MFVIKEELTSKLVVERSKFLGYCFCCENLQQQSLILKKIKSQHPSATHVCYASCFFNNNQIDYYSSDDREPSGTAGLQMVNKLKEYKLINVICIVVRYFGGVKLGVPNLSKAYKDCCNQTLQENTKQVELKTKCNFFCDYSRLDKIKSVLESLKLAPQDIKYDNQITFFCYMSEYEQKQILNKNIEFIIDKTNIKFC